MLQSKHSGASERGPGAFPARVELGLLGLFVLVFVLAWLEGVRPMGIAALGGWLQEDGAVEWLSVAGLLALAVLCVSRLRVFRGHRPVGFFLFTGAAAAAFLFGAGEEVSWGQRLLEFRVPDWFLENNRQNELNLHNLVIGTRDLNTWLFGRVITAGLALYLLLPLAHAYSAGFRRIAGRWGLPVARARHGLCLVAVALLLQIAPMPGRSSELFELAAVLTVLAAFLNPVNAGAFRRPAGRG